MVRDIGYLVDMMEHGRVALGYVRGFAREHFMANPLVQDAVIRRIGVVGEAARHVSPETRSEFPDLPWKRIIATRNVLVHDYDSIDLDTLWRILDRHVPAMVEAIDRYLASKGIREEDESDQP